MPASPRIPALDGVRALAVSAVLAAHTGLPGVSGGFIGVDVFFVLSGFLISSLLLDERVRTGGSNLTAFWARRARRLLPAALVMIAAVIAVRPWLPLQTRGGLRDDALSAALWSSNWRWARQGTDYFAQGGTASPLQHTWSLAVEEQFYLIWPLLLLMAWAGTRGTRARAGRLFTLATVGVIVSAVTTVRMSGTATPGRVYFGTDVRAQELLVGAALAAVLAPTWRWLGTARRAKRSPQIGRGNPVPSLLVAVGLAGLGLAAHVARGRPSDFRHGFLLAVALASAAVIAGLVLDSRSVFSRILSSGPLVWLGSISYGVYLWHWPIFQVVNGTRTGLDPYPLALLRVGVTLTFATVSALLVELPVRRASIRPVRLLPAVAAGIAAVLGFAVYAAPGGLLATPTADGVDLPPGVTSTTVAHVGGPVRAAARNHKGPLVVDVFGDSIGWTLTHYAPPSAEVQLVDRTSLGCGIAQGGPFEYFGQEYSDNPICDSWPGRWKEQIEADRPDEVLLVVGRWETMNRTFLGERTHIGEPAYDAYLGATLREAVDVLASSGARVIIATEPYNRRGEQPDGSLFPEDDPSRVDRWNALVAAQVAAQPRIGTLDLHTKLCPDGRYTWNVDGVQVRSDGVHVSESGVRWLAPWFNAELLRLRS